MSPEFALAAETYRDRGFTCNRMTKPPQTPEEGSFVGLLEPVQVRQLRSDEGWYWNQAKSPVEVSLPEGVTILIRKLILRPKKDSRPSSPPAKIWTFSQRGGPAGSLPAYAVWFQKLPNSGNRTSSTCDASSPLEPVALPRIRSTPLIMDDPFQLRLEDYDFLAPFMESTLADEFWPNRKMIASTPLTYSFP
jgi:hypothetical protein